MIIINNILNITNLGNINLYKYCVKTAVRNADLTPKHCFYGRPRTSTDVLSTAALRFFDQNRKHPGEDFVVTLVQRVITTSYGCVTGT